MVHVLLYVLKDVWKDTVFHQMNAFVTSDGQATTVLQLVNVMEKAVAIVNSNLINVISVLITQRYFNSYSLNQGYIRMYHVLFFY